MSKKPALSVVNEPAPTEVSPYAPHADLLASVLWAEGARSTNSENTPQEVAATLLGALCVEVKTLSALLRAANPDLVGSDLANAAFMIERRVEATEKLVDFLAWSCRANERAPNKKGTVGE